jgi:hypothetical protein
MGEGSSDDDTEGQLARAERLARAAVDPLARNAGTAAQFTEACMLAQVGIPGLTHALEQLAPLIHAGDTQYSERMLFVQANTLDAIFTKLARQAAGAGLNESERYLRLALKAQSQSRVTLETLAAIKNPPIIFAKQANIAHGHQQVNNDAPPRARENTKAIGKTKKTQTKLLEKQVNELQRVDARAMRKAGNRDTKVAAVETINGTAKRRRKGNG